ncbi:MAG: sulfotransferase [Ardenticatenaceae bacterium]|nr:sulfotransferase [Ardenticatenaceae bacterium]
MYRKIIAVVGMPRSGTSWLSQILDSSPQVRFRLSPFFSYEFKNAVNQSSSKEDYERVFQGAYQSSNNFMNQTDRRMSGHYPTFQQKENQPEFLAIKMTRFHNLLSRILDLFDDLKMVAIVRHPCGAIHSWLTHPREFPREADPLQEWRTGKCRKTAPEEFWGFEDWKKVTRLHLQLERDLPDKFRIMRYEDLVANSVRETVHLFAFLGLVYTAQTDHFLKLSQQQHCDDPYAVYKLPYVKNRWKEELDPRIRKEILAEIQHTDLARFLE